MAVMETMVKCQSRRRGILFLGLRRWDRFYDFDFDSFFLFQIDSFLLIAYMFIAHLLQILMNVWFLGGWYSQGANQTTWNWKVKSLFLVFCFNGVIIGCVWSSFFFHGWVKLVVCFFFFNSWAIIASKFKDKTTRQCRRRYNTSIYLCFFYWIMQSTSFCNFSNWHMCLILNVFM